MQAPAGSGKTELLTQRFLKLLCHTRKSPEEVVAVTFTRKAAGEMRERILSSLAMAESDNPPEEPHKKITWILARDVLKRDKKRQWNLQNNPNRLRILTIDALAAHIAKQIPLPAKLSPQLKLAENPRPYYREAVQQIILSIGDAPHSHALKTLLMHLDNRVYQLEYLLMQILSKREQWLPHIVHQKNGDILKQQMEKGLQNIAAEKIEALMPHITDDIACELIPLAHFAGQYCKTEDPNNPISVCHDMQLLPGAVAESLPYWKAIASIFLTLKGEWRKSITKRQGFPANEKEIKTQLKALLPELEKNDTLRECLFEIMQCPPLHYTEQQWEALEALSELLPLLAAQLNVIFQENGTSDFVELNLAALRALGEPDNPTDLALYLDHQITHLLVDEFQDTSIMQFELIEKLLTGWENNDGRSVFLVGDPMQSIYRFRNAEVGLFLRTQEHGIAELSLNTLGLEKNFRSTPAVVDWTNQNFHSIFPKRGDMTSGSVPHAPATAASNNQNGKINWHPLLNDDGSHEAQTIVNIIQEKQKDNPDNTIAILVRSRAQLIDITSALHENKLNFKAIDIEPLNDCMEIQDAHTLTRALLHRVDSVSWLALLRAPYCGLLLKDLYIIAEDAKNSTLWKTLKNYKKLTLSDDAKKRLDACFPALYDAVENFGRMPLSQTVKNLWLALRADRILEDETQLDNVASYFKLIENLEQSGSDISLTAIEEKLFQLYAEPNPNADDRLQIMTIHKSKGLEFDHVILPGLNRKTPYDSLQLLMWLERPNNLGHSDLILAPIKSAAEYQDPIYQYLRRIEKTKADNETARLLYVATTRAKQSIDFIASTRTDEKDPEIIAAPKKGSFLELLWHTTQLNFIEHEPMKEVEEKVKTLPQLKRVPSEFFEPKIITSVLKTKPAEIKLEDKTARVIGTLIHEALEKLSQNQSLPSDWTKSLKQLGIKKNNIEDSERTITKAINNTLNDKRGQWILSNKHQDTQSEYPLTGIINDECINVIIDRTFIDETGTRWIIDYKTGESEDPEQYREQLETYAQLFTNLENRPIKLALYFPLTAHWVEWKDTPSFRDLITESSL